MGLSHDVAAPNEETTQETCSAAMEARPEQRNFTVLQDPEALARHAAAWLVETLNLGAGKRRAVCLSGGSTPRRLYETLAQPPYSGAMPWRDIHWFWCDERWVPPDHERSNYRMVRAALLARVPVDDANVHPIPTLSGTPIEAAERYEKELKDFYGAPALDAHRPLFDVTLLGVGEDGHTASLFPGSAALEERTRWVRAVFEPETRITLTYPAIESSRDVVFLVTGAAKRNVMRTIREGAQELPASRVRPVGHLHWFVDRDAVGDSGVY